MPRLLIPLTASVAVLGGCPAPVVQQVTECVGGALGDALIVAVVKDQTSGAHAWSVPDGGTLHIASGTTDGGERFVAFIEGPMATVELPRSEEGRCAPLDRMYAVTTGGTVSQVAATMTPVTSGRNVGEMLHVSFVNLQRMELDGGRTPLSVSEVEVQAEIVGNPPYLDGGAGDAGQ